MNGELINQIRELYQRREVAKAILDEFAQNYQRNMNATSVANLAYRVQKTETQIKEACREFEKLRLGRYVPGRWSSPSRFEWAYKIKELGAVATGAKDSLDEGPFSLDIETSQPSVEEPARSMAAPAMANGTAQAHASGSITDIIIHRFKLRPDYEVEVELPSNLTSTEASRFARFVTSLPFNTDPEA